MSMTEEQYTDLYFTITLQMEAVKTDMTEELRRNLEDLTYPAQNYGRTEMRISALWKDIEWVARLKMDIQRRSEFASKPEKAVRYAQTRFKAMLSNPERYTLGQRLLLTEWSGYLDSHGIHEAEEKEWFK